MQKLNKFVLFFFRLTAFVVKSFAQARKYIYVDQESLDLSLQFMAKKQNRDGSFPTLGKVHGSYLKV